MKIPQINYRRLGVQNLGRKDISAPQRVAAGGARLASLKARNAGARAGDAGQRFQMVTQLGNAEIKASQERQATIMGGIATVGKIALDLQEAEELQEYHKNVLEYETNVKRSTAELTTTNTIDLENIDLPAKARGLLSKYDQTIDKEGVTHRMAPSHEVIDAIHSARIEEWQGAMTKDLSRDMAGKFYGSTKTMTANSSNAVFTKGTQDRVALNKAKSDINFENAKMAMDYVRAKAIGESAYRSGAWDIETFTQNMIDLPAEIDERYFNRQVALAETSAQLDTVLDDLLEKPHNLDAGKEQAIVSRALTRQDKIETKTLASIEKRKTNNRIRIMKQIDQGDLTLSELYQLEGSIAPGQFMSFRTAIRMRDDPNTTVPADPEVLNSFNERAIALQFPPDGTDVAVMSALIKADGFEAVKRGSLRYKDYKQLTDDVDSFVDAGYNTPEYKSVHSAIALSIVGADPDAELKRLFAGGGSAAEVAFMREKAQVVADARLALQNYMRHAGVKSDPVRWWDANKDRYTAEGQEKSRANKFISAHPDEALYGPNRVLDTKATLDSMVDKMDRGVMSPAEYDLKYRVLFGNDTRPGTTNPRLIQ